MSIKAITPGSLSIGDFDDDIIPPKIDQTQVRNKVLEILQKPCTVDAKELVQRATFGVVDPFDAFDPEEFKSKIKR